MLWISELARVRLKGMSIMTAYGSGGTKDVRSDRPRTSFMRSIALALVFELTAANLLATELVDLESKLRDTR